MKPSETLHEAGRFFRTAPFSISFIFLQSAVGIIPFAIEGFPNAATALATMSSAVAIREAILVTRVQLYKRRWLEQVFKSGGMNDRILVWLYGKYWCDRQTALVAAESVGVHGRLREYVEKIFQSKPDRKFPSLPHL